MKSDHAVRDDSDSPPSGPPRAPQSGAVLRAGDFEFDPGQGQLRERGRPVALRPQTVLLLSLLLRKPGHLVTREEIEEAIWASDRIDHEQGINACVRELRQALSDDARAPTFVETVPRRGYRFVAPVEPVVEDAGGSAGADSGRRSWALRFPAMLLGVMAALAAIAILWVGSDRFSGPGTVWVAIVPVQHGGASDEARASGVLLREIIAQGDRLPAQRFDVTPWEIRWSYDRASGQIEHNGREVGVDYLVEAELRRTDDRAVVALRLFRVQDGALLWSETLTGPASQLQGVMEEAARRIVERIRQLGI